MKVLPYWIWIHVYNRLNDLIADWAIDAPHRDFDAEMHGKYLGERARFMEEYCWNIFEESGEHQNNTENP